MRSGERDGVQMATEKTLTPAYVSPKSLFTFLAQRRADGHITDVIDKSLMKNFSGSTQNEMTSALKFLKLINDKGEPTALYRELITEADEAVRTQLAAKMLREAYGFVFEAPGFSLERGTTFQLSELFKKAGASGSTMVRGISFFLATAKAAGFKISSTIQAPTLPRAPRSKTAKKPIALAQAEKAAAEGDGDDSDDSGDDSGVMRFEIPIPVDRRVRITIPADFNSADWTLLQTMFTAYVTRWQAMEGQKDKGPTPVKE
jgi:hypothetical protein